MGSKFGHVTFKIPYQVVKKDVMEWLPAMYTIDFDSFIKSQFASRN